MLIMLFTTSFMVILTKHNHPISPSAANLDNHQSETDFFTYM